MYVLGNIEYFATKPVRHWDLALELLKQPAADDTNTDGLPSNKTIEKFDGSRLGPQLPICCPQHRIIHRSAKEPKELKLGFCTVKCDSQLKCSHPCNLKCHWPSETHNPKCQINVASPCTAHPQMRPCHTFTLIRGNLVSLEVGLAHYQCDVMVDVSRPCSHVEKVTCYKESQISKGVCQWDKCTEPALQPFVYDVCKHIRQENCSTFHEWTKNSHLVPQCTQMVPYVPPCGHNCNIKCWQRSNYTNQTAEFKCHKIVEMDLPRCRHSVKVHCSIATSLSSWRGTSSTTVGEVTQGASYGTKDYDCKEPVTFIRECGHRETLPCSTAFEYAFAAPKCTVKTDSTNPVCGHPCTLECHEVTLLSNVTRPPQLGPVTEVDERFPQKGFVSTSVKTPMCITKVTLQRACGHYEEVSCCQSRSSKPCHAQVMTKNPLCGHNLQLRCAEDVIIRNWKPWEASSTDSLVKKLFEERVLVESIPQFNPPPANIQRLVDQCSHDMKVQRDKSCGHFSISKCNDVFKKLQHGQALTSQNSAKCLEIVLEPLVCGHTHEFVCWEHDTYKRDRSSYICKEEANRQCWNFKVCKQRVVAPCSMPYVACSSRAKWLCPTNSEHCFDLELCSKGILYYLRIL